MMVLLRVLDSFSERLVALQDLNTQFPDAHFIRP